MLLHVWSVSFAWDFGRYLVAAGIAFVVVWVWGRERWRGRLIGKYATRADIRREVTYSLGTALVFSLVGTGLWFGAKAGIFKMYDAVALHGVPWFVLSVIVLVVLQDTYFYWTHRAMHVRWLFARMHHVHHRSHNPSPWAAYAFSPAEALVHAAFVPLVTLVMPVHTLALFAFLAIMIARNAFGHLGVELLPRSFIARVGWSTTTTHHALHHHRSDVNYGLYFTLWDRLMGTTHPDYERTFARVTG
jgi:lathosterol oxidase